jgi:hypothetical protein
VSYVNESNFDTAFPVPARDEYWRRVKYALRHYFNTGEAVADRYREAVESASSSVGEQLLVYHEDPFSLAADLADARATMDQHRNAYSQAFPNATLGASPLPLP